MSNCTIKSITKGATSPNETKDCTVRALANATGIPYKDAHALLKKVGRKDKEGISLPVVLNAFEDLAIKPVYISSNTKDGRYLCMYYGWTNPNKGMSLGKAVKTFTKGKYIALVNCHVIALVDGHLIDIFDNPGKQYLRALFEVQETFEQTVTNNS